MSTRSKKISARRSVRATTPTALELFQQIKAMEKAARQPSGTKRLANLPAAQAAAAPRHLAGASSPIAGRKRRCPNSRKPAPAEKAYVPEVTLEEFNTFLWLTEAEKAAVRARAAADPLAFDNARGTGLLMGLAFAKPGLDDLLFPANPDAQPLTHLFNPSAPPIEKEWDDHAPLSAEQKAAFAADVEANRERRAECERFLGLGSEDPLTEVGAAMPAHGVITLDDKARAAVEAKATEALATDRQRVAKEEEWSITEGEAKAEEARVNELLRAAGEDEPEICGRCIRAGLVRGNFGFQFTGKAAELDKPLAGLRCFECGAKLKVTVRELLAQVDDGDDYEEGGEDAVARCPKKDCRANNYVTGACCGRPQTDCGRAFKHCTECPGLGICAGDVRCRHCERCGRHAFVGTSGLLECVCYPLHQTLARARKGDRAALAALHFHKILFRNDEPEDESGSD